MICGTNQIGMVPVHSNFVGTADQIEMDGLAEGKQMDGSGDFDEYKTMLSKSSLLPSLFFVPVLAMLIGRLRRTVHWTVRRRRPVSITSPPGRGKLKEPRKTWIASAYGQHTTAAQGFQDEPSFD